MTNKLPDFDTLKHMAQHAPEALSTLLHDEVEKLINSAPEHSQRRLRGLQFQIDAQRQTHDSPMGACIAISKMMHESFYHLRHMLNQVKNEGSDTMDAIPDKQEEPTAQQSAQILSFPTN